MPSKLDAALDLAERGFYVFPCVPNWKKPIYEGGFKQATRDANRIQSWWYEHPDANPAIYPAMSKHMVVDIDPAKGGDDTAFELEMDGLLPTTMAVNTWSGGRHLYYDCGMFDVPKSSVELLGDGIDIRAEGGYVLAPGSMIGGSLYVWDTTCNPAPAPADLIHRCGEARQREENAAEFVVEPDLEVNVRRAEKFLENTQPAIEGSGGHDWTYRTAAKVRSFGISEQMCYQLMLDGGDGEPWNDRCVPPWDMDELYTVIGNAYRYAKNAGGNEVMGEDGITSLVKKLAAEEADREPEAGEIKGVSRENPFRAYTIQQAIAVKPMTWLIDGVLPEAGLGVIYGQPESYKSFLTLDLALRVAAGQPWADCATTQGSVLYMPGEGHSGMRSRHVAWLEANSDADLSRYLMLSTTPQLGDDTEMGWFAEAIRELRPSIGIIDTLASAMGGLNENSQQDVSLVISHLSKLSAAFGTAFLLVHHAGKDSAKGMRGGSGLRAAADVVLEVTKPRDKEALVRMDKMKDAEKWRTDRGFSGSVVADSLVFRPDDKVKPMRAASTRDEQIQGVWAARIIEVLQDDREHLYTPRELVTSVEAFIGRRTPEGEEPEPLDYESMYRWLTHEGKDHPDLANYVKRPTASGNYVWTARDNWPAKARPKGE